MEFAGSVGLIFSTPEVPSWATIEPVDHVGPRVPATLKPLVVQGLIPACALDAKGMAVLKSSSNVLAGKPEKWTLKLESLASIRLLVWTKPGMVCVGALELGAGAEVLAVTGNGGCTSG